MYDNRDPQNLLARIDAANQEQLKYAKLQCIFSAVAAVCCATVLILLICLLPKVTSTVAQLNDVVSDVNQVTSQLARADWDGLVDDLEMVSQQLASADLGSLVADIDALVRTTQEGVENALNKLNAIDLDSLNKAIQDLSDVVAPLARIVNKF